MDRSFVLIWSVEMVVVDRIAFAAGALRRSATTRIIRVQFFILQFFVSNTFFRDETLYGTLVLTLHSAEWYEYSTPSNLILKQ